MGQIKPPKWAKWTCQTQRRVAGEATRIDHGSEDVILTLRDMSRILPVAFKLFIVQPGLAKSEVSQDQLLLLSVT